MVRVISVHHFANQHVQTVEQPTASTVAPPHRLLLALSSHCIEVRDLKSESDVLFTFPTVDQVSKIVHCLNGDYVATLETKFNRQNRQINFARVYVNWDSIATLQQSKMTSGGVSLGSSECGMVQPMRARIAGRVTPTTNQSELGSLEMIEIPVSKNPSNIQCCQISGNILIQSNRYFTIYTFHIKTHDISKLRFIDFEELPMHIELSFAPLQIAFCENYFAYLNKDQMHMFKIVPCFSKDSDGFGDKNDSDFNFKYNQENVPVNYGELLKAESANNTKDKITICLPSIVKSNSIIHKYSPFTFCDKDMNASLKFNSPLEVRSHNCEIINLIQLKLKPILIENAQAQISEEFKCLVLKPLYVEKSQKNKTDECYKWLKSDYRQNLNSVICMISTQQEGYLYHFADACKSSDIAEDNCISVYSFTAPVHKIVMEDYLLHALTETGLESYTLRTGHKLSKNIDAIDNINIACPPASDPICLVGLRPFLGIEQMLLADNYLVLLANADISPTHSIGSNNSSNSSYWTLYNLELPSPKAIFNDICIVANAHRFTSPQTYCHLMNEAHIILRVALMLTKWSMVESCVNVVTRSKKNNEDLIETYRTSCALLGDHFIMCSNDRDYCLCVPYYKMAGIVPFDILKRVKKLEEQSNIQVTKGLVFYLKTILLDLKFGAEADKFFKSGTKQNFVEEVLSVLEKHSFNELPYLILKSSILREYSTHRFVEILSADSCSSDTPNEKEKLLALVTLYIQQCKMNKAREILETFASESLYKVLLDNWELLFEQNYVGNKNKGTASFSELTVLLMSTNSDVVTNLFVYLIIDKKAISINKILKIYLEYLPSRIGYDGNAASLVLLKTLEQFFKSFFASYETKELPKVTYDRSTQEALKIFIRSLLSQLQILQLKDKTPPNDQDKGNTPKITPSCEENETEQERFKYNHVSKTHFEDKSINKKNSENYLFASLRYEYLDKMPPFQVEVTSKLYQACVPDYLPKDAYVPNEEADLVLKKLQALLSSQAIPKAVITEVNTFLTLNENLRGNSSLKSVTMSINEAVLFLIDNCPQCLLQYGKDRFTKIDEWKFLIAAIQRRIIRLSLHPDLKPVCFFHKKLLRDILTHVATSMNLEQLLQVFPQQISKLNNENGISPISSKEMQQNTDGDGGYNCIEKFLQKSKRELDSVPNETDDILNEIQNYDPYVTICKDTMHANQIKKLITTTGQQLLCTLNL